jgi:RHS repeat-associated protein
LEGNGGERRDIVTDALVTNRHLKLGRPLAPYFYRARYYSPGLHRFLSEDPIGFLGGDINLYGYVANNPNSRFDPLGLAYCDLNFTYGTGLFLLGVTGGVMAGPSGVYVYGGGGLVAPTGPSGAFTCSTSNPSARGNFALQIQGPTGASQFGWSPTGGLYSEFGAGFPPGVSLTAFYAWKVYEFGGPGGSGAGSGGTGSGGGSAGGSGAGGGSAGSAGGGFSGGSAGGNGSGTSGFGRGGAGGGGWGLPCIGGRKC